MNTFKEMEISGFKSFADPTKISFDSGVTAIVGPNGCGKSNISDAIRWVLGERSNKALRGKTSQDVIFAGTEKRKKLSYCEVSLIFDNTNHTFNIDYDEVVFTRKLYRSGESDYMINRKPCRQKDIIDLMYDSGIGKDGYSIIGQGRVDEIINSKPEDRRTIFEEAAGISKYKARKTETENRLNTVRANLERANDIVGEVSRRLGPLKKQSEDAKKYLELRDELKSHEINAYIYQYDHAAQTKQDINVKLQGLRDNLNVLVNSIETEQAKYDKSLNEINQLDKKASDLHEQVLKNSLSLEKRQSDSRLLTEQTRYLREQMDRLKTQIDTYNTDLNQRQALVNAAKESKEEQQQKLSGLLKTSQEIHEKYLTLIDELTKSEGEKEASQREMIDNLEKLTEIKSNISAYIAKRDTMSENIKQDKAKLEELTQEKTRLNSECGNLIREVDALLTTKQSKASDLSKITEKMQALEQEISVANEQIYALKTSISNDTNRKNILANLQADFEGYQFAVKRLLQEGKKNPALATAIKGVVGNVIMVDSKYQTAIEIALGGSIQNVITKDEQDANKLISFLKNANLGRATFLPLNAVKQRTLSANDRQYLSAYGCLGLASELVKTEEQFRPVINSLLGSTLVCDTFDNAVQIARRSGYSFRIVTLGGEVLSPQGSISGGSKKSNDSSILGKENEIKSLEENILKRTKELNQYNTEYSQLLEKQNKLKVMLEQENAAYQTVVSNYTTKSAYLDAQKDKMASIEEDIFSYQSQIKIAENIVTELNTKINSIDSSELNYNNSRNAVTNYEDSNKNAYEQLKQKREQYAEEMTASKVQIASTEEKIRSLSKDIEVYTAEIENVKKQIENVQKELDSQLRVYNETINLSAMKEEDEKSKKIQAELDSLNQKLAQFDEFKQSLMNELKVIDDKKTKLQDEKSRLDNKIYQEETKLQKVDIDIENMQERIYEEYEMTYTDCLPFKTQDENFDIKETMIRISRIKAQITSLGFININAIEEYKTEGARYDEMLTQIEDLKKAEEDAVKIITDLSKEMLEKFNAEFIKIQENFTKVFKELFGGGNARLELLPSEDPLTAGVEIIAQPPGKVLSQITLLSGGEKTMTAIAILFAILKLKPMPFCFLDEIEAALDDANIDRYARYLKRFSDDTQFIVITHRKPTMELADSLYGVTMEEKGVSKVVSVKLSDAVKVSSEESKKQQAS